MEKVEKLEKEIQELRFKVTNLEKRVINTEMFISYVKDNINSGPVQDNINPFFCLNNNLTISEPMETIINTIYSNTVPASLEHSIYPSHQNTSNMYMVSAKDNINPEPVSQEEVPLESNDKSNNSPVLSTTNSTQSPNTNNLPIVSNIADNENNSVADNIPENEKNNSVVDNIHDNEKNNSVVDNIHDNENNTVENNIHDNENNTVENNIPENENNSVVDNIPENENNTLENIISEKENNTIENNIPENEKNNAVENNIPEKEKNNIVNQNTADQNIQLKAPKNINTESWIGKILMGALASLLVFIALITFAKVLMPYLTNTIKITLMFIVSIALTATGYVFSTKKPENTFYKALLACGSACIYLSILITDIYFKAIDSIDMYILIALWAILNIFFKKDKEDWLFFTIGNLGYLVSVIFSAGLKDNDKSLIIPLLIYVVMISVVYHILYWKNERQKYIQSIINVISLLLFQLIMTFKFDDITEVLIVGIVSVAFIFIFFIEYMFYNNNKESISITLVNISIYFLSIYLANEVTGVFFKTISLIVMYVLITLWTILNIFFKKDKNDWLFFTVGNLGYLGSIVFSTKLKTNNTSFIIPILIYTLIISMVYQIMYWKNERQRYIQGIINVISILLFQLIMTSKFEDITEVLIVGIVSVAFIFTFFIKYMFNNKKNIYITLFNTSIYLACLYQSIMDIGMCFKEISLIVMYVLVILWTILNIFFKKDKNDWLFYAIGNIIYFVSIVSSSDLKFKNKSFIIPVLIYALMITVAYQILYWKNKYQKHIQSIINVISLLLFQIIITSIFKKITEVIIVGLVTMAFIYIFLIKYTFIDLLKYKKDYNDIFIAAINTSVYLICLYLSIKVTGIYFKTTSLIVMYVLVILWTILNIFFKKDKNDWLFYAIGNIIYFVSIVSSSELKINDKSFIIPVLIYALMIAVTYQIIYWKNEYQRHIQSIINVMSLLLYQVILMSTFRKTTEVNVVGIVVMVFALIGIIEYTIFDLFTYKKKHFYIALVNTSVYLISYFLLHMSMEYELPVNLTYTVIIIPTVILEVINMYWRSKNLAEDDETFRNGVLTLVLFYAASAIISTSFLYHSGIILTGYSLIMIYGIIKKDSFFKNQGWILISLCMFTKIDLFGKSTAFTIVATILSLLSLIVEGFIFNDSEIYKIISYFAMLLWIVRIEYYTYVERVFAISNEYIIIITYGIVALLNMILILTKFYKTKKNKNISNLFDSEKNSIIRIILDVLNLTYMLLGVKMMYILDIDMLKTIYTIIVIILAFINLPVKDKGSRERYIYTAIKFSFLIYYSLWIFKIQNYVISISMIAFAVVCIAVGFRNRLIGKELRIYGLVMTIIFVIKLIIIDISYDSSILKAFSYLISGTLCFGISAIYNYFEDNKNTEENDIVNNKKNN